MVGTLLHAISIAVQLSLLFCAVIAVGCSGAGEDARREERERAPRPPAGGYEPIEVVNGGTVTGTVSWSGDAPELAPSTVETHADVCGASQPSPVLALGRRGGVAGTVVWLDGIRSGRALPPSPSAEVAIEGCRFQPHVVAVPVGARLLVRNLDGVLHNVRGEPFRGGGPLASGFSHGLPERGASREIIAEHAGVTRLVDDAGHPWMLGWVHAFPHPYFAVSDAEGRFQLTGIPPGQYVLRAWHEGVRATGATEAGRPVYSAPIVLTRPVTVQRGTDTAVDFELSAAAADAAGD